MKPSEKIKSEKEQISNSLDQDYIQNLKKQLHFMSLEIEVLWVKKKRKTKKQQGIFRIIINHGGQCGTSNRTHSLNKGEVSLVWKRTLRKTNEIVGNDFKKGGRIMFTQCTSVCSRSKKIITHRKI